MLDKTFYNTHKNQGPCAVLRVAIVLPKSIAAIQVLVSGDGKDQMSAISQLPAGSELRMCGEGFNARTVRVECSRRFYFVFLQDLEQTY